MELIIALAIGLLAGCGVWLMLRPRTFQVVLGLSLLSYAVNLFIFSVGSLSINKEPIVRPGVAADLLNYTDPLPQSLVLTAIVIADAELDHVDPRARERADTAGAAVRCRRLHGHSGAAVE